KKRSRCRFAAEPVRHGCVLARLACDAQLSGTRAALSSGVTGVMRPRMRSGKFRAQRRYNSARNMPRMRRDGTRAKAPITMGIERLVRAGHGKLAAFSQLMDALVIGGGLYVVCWSYGVELRDQHLYAALWAVGAFLFFAHLSDLYHSWRGLSVRYEFGRLLLIWAAVVTTLLFVAYLSKTSGQFSRRVFLT